MSNGSESLKENCDYGTEAVLIAPYRLPHDYTVVNVAEHFALKLRCAVEHENGKVSGEGVTRELFKMQQASGPDYVLVLGESDLSFYKEFVVIQPGGEFEDFCIWRDDFEEGGNAVKFYDQHALDDLRNLGIDELYCIKNNIIPNAALSVCSLWHDVEAHLLDEEEYFIIPLQADQQEI